jgi:hypothetical protein
MSDRSAKCENLSHKESFSRLFPRWNGGCSEHGSPRESLNCKHGRRDLTCHHDRRCKERSQLVTDVSDKEFQSHHAEPEMF